MNEPNLPPEQWRPLFDKIGVEFGYRPLAAYARMNHTRVRRLLLGGGTTDEAVRELAHAFRVRPEEVYRLRGDTPPGVRPFTLPDDAGRLNETERRVIRAMVRALLDAREQGDASTSETTPAPDQEADGTAGDLGTPITRAAYGGEPDNVHALNRRKQGPTPAPNFANPGELAAARKEPGYTKSGKRDQGFDEDHPSE